MRAQTTKQGTVCSVQEDRTAPPGRYRPLWEILKVSDDKVTHHFYQKGAFGLNGEVSFTRKGRWEPSTDPDSSSTEADRPTDRQTDRVSTDRQELAHEGARGVL